MTEVPHYTKILKINSRGTEHALEGNVVVQEKVDGSMFRFGWDENGELSMASHHAPLYPESPGKFAPAVEHVMGCTDAIIAKKWYPIWCYCEYLGKPKQITLAYERVPTNHLVLFDAMYGGGVFASRVMLQEIADLLHIDLIPELYYGIVTMDDLTDMLTTDSYLGNEKIEGVVVKNYNENIQIGPRLYPLFVKYVRPAFQERHGKEWKQNTGKSNLQAYMESFAAEPRWVKAIQRMSDEGTLQDAPRDIGSLVKLVQADIIDEEAANIKEELYRLFIGDITRLSVRGLAEWYKKRLAKEDEELAIICGCCFG
jgi:hypothetical protein